MHLKSYQINGRLLRTGAANFSAPGLKRQDVNLIVIERAGGRVQAWAGGETPSIWVRQ
jgi:hypothetical protein